MATFIVSLILSILLSSYSNGTIGRVLSNGAYSNVVPGIAFGICLLLTFRFALRNKYRLGRSLVFLAISVLAYFAAVWGAIYSSEWIKGNCSSWGPCDNQLRLAFFIAGVIGGFILSAIGLKLTLKTVSWTQVLILTLLSGALGFCSVYILSSFDLYSGTFPILGLYLVWQTGMAAAIFICIKKYQNKFINSSNVRI